MKITLLCVGKLKEKYFKQAVDEYSKRLSRYCKLNIIELQDEKAPESMSKKEEEQVKQKEGQRILKKLRENTYIIALAIQGKKYSSEEFANYIQNLGVDGYSDITFIIGGSLGLSDEILQKANSLISFSDMTFPHQLMRIIFLEQVYRCFRINNGEPYHK